MIIVSIEWINDYELHKLINDARSGLKFMIEILFL